MAKTTDERTTPWPIVHMLEKRYGVFDLDAAATEFNARSEQWLGPGGAHEDALDPACWWRDFGYRVFLNPPYSEIPKWLAKVRTEVRRDASLRVVVLLPSSTSAAWFHRYIWKNQPVSAGGRGTWRPLVRDVYIPDKRIEFEPHSTGAKWPSIVIQFGRVPTAERA